MNENLIKKIQDTFCGCEENDCGKEALEDVLDGVKNDLVALCEDNTVMAELIENYFEISEIFAFGGDGTQS